MLNVHILEDCSRRKNKAFVANNEGENNLQLVRL
jgi:hypothetical protein